MHILKISPQTACTTFCLQPGCFFGLALTARFSSLRTKIFVAEDEDSRRRGRRFSSLATKTCCVREAHTKDFLSLTTIFNIKYAGNSFSSLTTEDKISVPSDKNRAVCARL